MLSTTPFSSIDSLLSEDLNYTHKKLHPYEVKLDLTSCMGDFWSKYCNEIFKIENEESTVEMSYMEHGSDHTPINITMVFKYDVDDRINYSSNFLTTVVSMAQYTITEIYDIPEISFEDDGLRHSLLYCCVLFGKDQYRDEENNVCCTISFRFPRCVVPTSSQTSIFRNRLIDNLRRVDILHHLPMPKNTSLESIIYTSPPMGDWTLYGSVSAGIKTRFQFEYLFDEIPIEDIQNNVEMEFPIEEYSMMLEECELFNPTTHRDCARYGFRPLDTYNNASFWLPMILSIGFCEIRTKVRRLDSPTNNVVIQRISSSPIKQPTTDTDVCIAQSIIGMIKRRTIDDWTCIGKALYACFEAPIFKGKTGLKKNDKVSLEHLAKDCWLSQLRKHGYNSDECSYQWDGFNQSNTFTLKSIAWMAKCDSPDEFSIWNSQWLSADIKRAVESAKKNDHMTVSNAFFRCFWLTYSYVEGIGKGANRWYNYRQHHWNLISETEMKEPVMRFREHVEHHMQHLSHIMHQSNDQNEKDLINNTIKLATDLYDKLGVIAWIKNIIEASKTYFIVPDFDKLANENKCLTGVRNGIIEVNDKIALFRPGRPEDYITKFTNVRYNEAFDDVHPDIVRYMEYIHQVFPDPELANLQLRFFSSLLLGVPSKHLYIWTGVGDNGKSTIVAMLNGTLGDDYVANISPTFITMKRGNSSSASPELAALRHCRLVVIQEPDEGEQLKTGKIKEATGGDKIRARALFENGGPINPTYQIVLQCNTIPEAKKEQAVTNRIMIVPFLATWKNQHEMPLDPEESRAKHIFRKDSSFMSNVHKFGAACLYMMVKYYPIFRNNPISEVPKIVVDHTTSYWNKVDVFSRYLTDRVMFAYVGSPVEDQRRPFGIDTSKELDINQRLSQYDIYADFFSWFRETGRMTRNGGEIPIYDKVIEECSKYLGEPTYQGWHGVILRNHEGHTM